MTAEVAHEEWISADDYLVGERDAAVKHEYLGGIIYAMAGATNAHNEIASNVLGLLHGQLRGKICRPYNSDTKVRVQLSTHTRFYYPDVMVVCQRLPREAEFQDSPVVIVEVTSDSTRRTDEQEKREAYLSISSLRTYILLDPQRPSGVVWRRAELGFLRERYDGLEAVIELPEIEAKLPLADAYEAVELSSREA